MTVGVLLKQARESAGLSVEQVAALTRIRPQIIRDLEVGDLASSGGIAYARGHIRSIAKVIGADPEILVSEFNSEADLGARSMSDLLAENSATPVRASKVKLSYKKLSLGAVVLIALLILVPAVGSFFHSSPAVKKSTTKPTTKATAMVSSTPTPTSTPTPAVSAPASTPSPVSTPSQLAATGAPSTISFTAVSANSWFAATDASGTVLWHGTLYKGATQSFTTTSLIDVTIGNAGAVDVTINGKDAGLSGTIGQVVHKQFGPGAQP